MISVPKEKRGTLSETLYIKIAQYLWFYFFLNIYFLITICRTKLTFSQLYDKDFRTYKDKAKYFPFKC